MYIYVELWNAKNTWLALSEEDRRAYVANIGPAMAALTKAGVELLGFAVNDDDTEHRANYRYIAVWRMADKALAMRLEETVVESGFYKYFEQVNGRGSLISPDVAFGDMVGLK
jgi:hypothetical protein